MPTFFLQSVVIGEPSPKKETVKGHLAGGPRLAFKQWASPNWLRRFAAKLSARASSVPTKLHRTGGSWQCDGQRVQPAMGQADVVGGFHEGTADATKDQALQDGKPGVLGEASLQVLP